MNKPTEGSQHITNTPKVMTSVFASCTSLSRPGTFFIMFQKFDRVNALEWAPGAGGLAIAPCVDVKFAVPYVFAQGNRIAPFLPRD